RRVHGAAAILPGAPRPLSVPLIGVQRARARARPRVRGGESARGGARCALQLRGRRRRWQPTNAARRPAGLLLLQLWWPTRLELRGRVALVVPGSGRRAAWVQAEESRVARGGDEGAVDMTAPHHPLEILPEAVARAVGATRYWFVIGGQAVRCLCPYSPSRDVDFGVVDARTSEQLLAQLRQRGKVELIERGQDTLHLTFDGIDVSIFVLPEL